MQTENLLSAALNASICSAVSVFIVHKLEIIEHDSNIIVKSWCGFPCSLDMLLKLYNYIYIIVNWILLSPKGSLFANTGIFNHVNDGYIV